MRVAIHQPEYLPWPGFFNKMLQSDVYAVLDNVQFSRGGFQNRNRIKTSAGPKWLSVPLSGRVMVSINMVNIDSSKAWPNQHLEAIRSSYSEAPYFKELKTFLENLYQKEFHKLIDLNLTIIKFLSDFLNIKAKLVLASTLAPVGNKTDLLIDICQKIGADVYLSGVGGKNYLEQEKFAKAGIKLEFQNYLLPEYGQLFEKFTPNLSIIDMICNVGRLKTLNLIS